MDALEILKIIMALFYVGFGVFAVLRPDVIATHSGYSLEGAFGRAELRVLSGGFFIGVGVGAILLGSVFQQENIAYQTMGFMLVGAAVVRMLNLALEDPQQLLSRNFFIYFAAEVIPGIILILPT
ncbi:MAG: DUF4345 family protein [Anaerolineales bacterium]